MGTLRDLLESTKVVHPVKLCLFLKLIVAAHEDVDLEGGAGSERLCHLGADKVRGGLNAGLEASSDFLQLQVPHHQVSKLIPISLFASRRKNLELIQLHDLVVVVLQCED